MSIKNNLKTIHQNITQAECQFGRIPHSVQLLAVSKTQHSSRIREAWEAGQKAFGENYLQEALPKIENLKSTDIEWHFIGPIQNNKTRKIAEHFSWVHTVEREVSAQRLNNQRPAHMPPLNICIQVNLHHELTKSGVLPEQTTLLVKKIISHMPQLRLRGLMAIPEVAKDFEKQRATFSELKQLLEKINQHLNLSLDTLSMGMSNDYIAAIAEGTTIVRLGTAIFGERPQ